MLDVVVKGQNPIEDGTIVVFELFLLPKDINAYNSMI